MPDAVVTGAFALGGVLIGYLAQFATTYAERNERKQRLKREKFELLCEYIQNSRVDVQSMLALSSDAALTSSNPTSAMKAHYLSLIYFQEMADVTREYSNSIALFRSFLFRTGFDPRVPASMGAQAQSHPEFRSKLPDVHAKRTAVEDHISAFASSYTRA